MIHEVYLENIKSYKAERIEFTRGVNAIIGENGAGKSTILEAIGFAVFNTLPYNISDFIRRGESRGEIRVVLESPADERRYVVVRKIERDRTAEYYVEDPEFGRVAEGVRAVKEWVKKHFNLDVEPEVVFENAIGVNQGNIISHFMLSASSRESVFSPLLGIEKYRKAFEKSREYQNLVEREIAEVEKELAVSTDRISVLEEKKEELRKIEKEHLKLRSILKKKTEELSKIEKELSEMRRNKEELDGLEREREHVTRQINFLKKEQEKILTRISEIEELEKELENLMPSYVEYQKLEKELESVKGKVDQLEKQHEVLKKKKESLIKLRAELESKKKDIEEKKGEIEKLKGIEQLAEREKTLREEFLKIEKAVSERDGILALIDQLEEELREKEEEVKRLRKKENELKSLSEKLKKLSSIEEKVEKVRKAVSRSEQKILDIREIIGVIGDGMCPVLNEECDRIRGERQRYEKELESEIERLKALKEKLEVAERAMKKKQEIEKIVFTLGFEVKKIARIEEELMKKERELKEQKERLSKIEERLKKRVEIEKELKKVSGSEAKLEVKRRLLKEIENLRSEIEGLEKMVLSLREEVSRLDKIEESLKSEKIKIRKIERKMDELRGDYESYLKVSEKVKEKEKLKLEKEKVEKEILMCREKLDGINARIDGIRESFDENRLKETENKFNELSSEVSRLSGEISGVERNLEMLRAEILKLEKEKEKFESLVKRKKILDEKLRFVKDLRDVFRKAVPELARMYSQAISVEANRIFCEIMDDYSWQIEWKEDYGIKARYMGREIDFRQMSGGEQMVSAIAVRLALLKILSSSPIVFLDEPTQNMDAERRRNFASQISRIADFRQIFVISHDDTFEEMVENAIRIRKENGVSVREDGRKAV